MTATIDPRNSRVLARVLDHRYPVVERAEGVWLHLAGGERSILDACSGGAMTTCLGHGNAAVLDAAEGQGQALSYTYNHHFTNVPQERLARRLVSDVAPTMARVRFVTGGSEANETALRLIRNYHVERGESERLRIMAPAQSYHGALMGTVGLTGRPSLRARWDQYLADDLHLALPHPGEDPDGVRALQRLDEALELAGSGTVAAYFCEAIGAASLPAYTSPAAFWQGLEQRRRDHGFLVCFDEVVTGVGRTGTWLAADQLPITPDIVTIGKGLGGGFAPIGAVLCTQDVYAAINDGSGDFDHGHTWDGAPLLSAVGCAVLEEILSRDLVGHVARRGTALLDEVRAALGSIACVGTVRGRGFLIGIELVDPHDGRSALPPTLDVERMVVETALRHDLLLIASSTAKDGFVPDQVAFAPAYTSTDAELAEMVKRTTTVLEQVERQLRGALAGPSS